MPLKQQLKRVQMPLNCKLQTRFANCNMQRAQSACVNWWCGSVRGWSRFKD